MREEVEESYPRQMIAKNIRVSGEGWDGSSHVSCTGDVYKLINIARLEIRPDSSQCCILGIGVYEWL
jgi:hypothetical protein